MFGPRESKDGGECLYNCFPNDLAFCRVQYENYEKLSIGGSKWPEGLCFDNGVCFGTPKACKDCKEKCDGFSRGSNAPSTAPTPAPAPISVIPRRLAPRPAVAACATKDGKKCQFPFIYKGEKYEACPPDPEDPNENWCSTRTNADGKHVGGGGHYGFCDNNCPLTR